MTKLKNKKYISNVILGFLIVVLPLFVWAILNERFDVRERASIVEATCVPVNKVITVTPTQSQSVVGSDTTCHDIQTAVNAAIGDGYTVQLTAGEYFISNQIDIANKSNLTIKGDEEMGSGAVVLNFTPGSGFNFLIQNSSGTIQWLTIQGGSSNGMLSIHNSNNFSVAHISAYSETSHTMDIQESTNISVYNSEIQSSAGAIEVSNSENITISNNRIHNSANAISIHNSSANIHSNLIYENYENAIVLNKPISVEIHSNTIVDNINNAGLYIIYVDPTYETIVNVYKNIFAKNKYGIQADSTLTSVDSFLFNFNDVWSNDTDYLGVTNKTGLSGNISSNPLFGDGYCVNNGSPVLYGLVSNGEYMGARLYCESPTPSPSPLPTSCNNLPILEIAPESVSGLPGETKRFDLTVTNNNHSSCEPVLVNLIVDKPSNWAANFSTQSFTLAPNHAYQPQLDVTPAITDYLLGKQPINIRASTIVGTTESQTIIYHLNNPDLKVGDVNSDDKVNLIDIGLIIDNYDSTNPTNPRSDVNNSGKVDIIDIGIIIDNYEW